MKRMHVIVAMAGEPNPAGVVYPEATLVEIRHQLPNRPVASARNGRVLATVSEAYLKKFADDDAVLPLRQALYAVITVADEYEKQVREFLSNDANYIVPIWDAPVDLMPAGKPVKVVQTRIVVRGLLLCPG